MSPFDVYCGNVFTKDCQTCRYARGGIEIKREKTERKRPRTRPILVSIAAFLTAITLTACGKDPVLAQFRKDMDSFCTKISEIDNAINSIDASADNAASDLLDCLDELDLVFQAFAKLDFPEEFDYLESLADESSQFMTEAVKNYHSVYGSGSYNDSVAEYAKQYYIKAYKRIQIIITFLHGDLPNDADLIIEYSN